MPWEGATVMEQRENLIRDYRLGYYSVSELSERFSISRKTAHKWISRYEEYGSQGFHERSRRPHHSPAKIPQRIRDAVIEERRKHPRWGPRKLFPLIAKKHPDWLLPAESAANRILKEADEIHPHGRGKRLHPGDPGIRCSSQCESLPARHRASHAMRLPM